MHKRKESWKNIIRRLRRICLEYNFLWLYLHSKTFFLNVLHTCDLAHAESQGIMYCSWLSSSAFYSKIDRIQSHYIGIKTMIWGSVIIYWQLQYSRPYIQYLAPTQQKQILNLPAPNRLGPGTLWICLYSCAKMSSSMSSHTQTLYSNCFYPAVVCLLQWVEGGWCWSWRPTTKRLATSAWRSWSSPHSSSSMMDSSMRSSQR